MLQIVVVMLKSAAGVVGRIDKDAFHLAAIERQQRFERVKVIALNEQVVLGRYNISSVVSVREVKTYLRRGLAVRIAVGNIRFRVMLRNLF